jgi:sec-independent protein translocase protein TatC
VTPPPVEEPPSDAGETGAKMGFLEHLDELRRRITWAAAAVMLGFVVAWIFSDRLLAFLLDPIQQAMGQLTVIRPAEAFMNKMKAALLGGIFLALPMILYQAWSFVAPGLYPRERRWILPVIASGSLLFAGGAAFSYYVAVPTAARFLAEQGSGFQSHITVDSAFSFASKLLLGLGAVFEMPLLALALARFGIVSARGLWKQLDKAIFAIFVLAAILTPTPDMMTMTIFALPMIGLYLLSIGVAWLVEPRASKGSEAP